MKNLRLQVRSNIIRDWFDRKTGLPVAGEVMHALNPTYNAIVLAVLK